MRSSNSEAQQELSALGCGMASTVYGWPLEQGPSAWEGVISIRMEWQQKVPRGTKGTADGKETYRPRERENIILAIMKEKLSPVATV